MARTVSITDIKTARRGRTAVRIASVLEAIAALKPGEALILDEFGTVDAEDRSRVYQSVRAHWADVRQDACRVSFDTDGNVVVMAKPQKGKRAAK